jgi:transcriptional regulator GlxA family with amidase domain
MLEGPPAAALDALRLVSLLAEMRGARRVPLSWQWSWPDGRAVRDRPAGPMPRGEPDVLLFGGWGARNGPHLDRLVERDRAACARLQAVHARGGQVMALYTGVALLGEAGLLEGREVSVPWPFVQSTARHVQQVRLSAAAEVTVDERVWTVASPQGATDALLGVLRALGLGDLSDAARTVLLPSPQRQRLAGAILGDGGTRVGPGALERARRWLEDHLHEPYSLAATAAAAATSPRSLLRHFQSAYGQSPLQMLHDLRITRARMLLETSYLPIEAIAEQCGWRDPAMLREVFRRRTGLTPADYRERFRLRTQRRAWGRELPRGRSGAKT